MNKKRVATVTKKNDVTVKKQNSKIEFVESRAKYRCSESLKNLVNLVNAIPPDRKLPHIQELFMEFGGNERLLNERVCDLLTGVPDVFLGDPDLVALRYVKFRSLRKSVHEMAQIAALSEIETIYYKTIFFDDDEKWQKLEKMRGHSFWREVSNYDRQNPFASWQWPKIETQVVIENGRVVTVKDDPLTALIEIDAKRLRECRICQRIFWARRVTTLTCSDQCSNTWRQRTYKKNNPAYEAARAKKAEEIDREARLKKTQK